jgi:hypothetical protein
MATKDEKNNFSILIEEIAVRLNVPYIEAIINYCDENGLEPEIAGTLVNDVLKSKLEYEAQQLRYLSRGSSLPI